METVELIAGHTRRLPESVQKEILNFVEFLLNKYSTSPTPATRQAGLHTGCVVIADDFSELPNAHKDPFDRLLIAQANVEEMALLSGDSIFKHYPVRLIWS